MHRLIKRQIQRIYGKGFDIEQLSEQEKQLIEQVSTTYEENDKERRFYEHTLEVNSRELNQKTETVQRALWSLAEAQRITHTGSWTLDLVTHELEWSDELYRIIGMEPGGIEPSIQHVRPLIHPEDLQLSDIDMRATYQQGMYDSVYRIRFSENDTRYIHEHRIIKYDQQNNPLMIQGTLQDVTAQKSAEEELRLFANVFHHSGEAIILTDRDLHVVAVNESFSKVTGYKINQARGQHASQFIDPETPDRSFDTIREELQNSGFWQGEMLGRKEDGSTYPKWISISVSRDEAGNIQYYIASFVDITERKADQERIHHLAHHDNLTGLINRFSLEQRLSQALYSSKRNNQKLALMFIDMDRFKIINDTMGHAAGDTLLTEVARRLKSSVRECDIVARIGGDEFVVVYTGLKDGLAAAPMARFLVHKLGMPYNINDSKMFSSPSIGISIYPSDANDGDTLMKNADTAMYHAKEAGRNNYQFFTEAMNINANQRLKLETDLRYAIEHQQFELHFQPLVCSQSNRTLALEALVRWRHPEQGMIPPDQFIPIAEETKLILPLGMWILEEACRQQHRWRTEFDRQVRVAVNLSAQQLQSSDLVVLIQELMQQYDMSEGDLELEVTESTAMENPTEAIKRLHEIRKLGIHLAIDDFGTGYSSLAYLKLLPIDTLKLDRAFVRDLEYDDNNAKISAATLALAHNLGLQVVAEGVENAAQKNFLISHGCELLQGYFFSKPLPVDEITEYILQH